jgi:imidazolonepropionase-like amidohydrolase
MPDPTPATLVLRDVRLYRSVVLPPEERATLVVVDGRVAPDGTPPPPGAPVLAGAGRTALPGLIDAHVHLPHLRPAETLAGYLRDGVTAVRSMGNSLAALAAARAGAGPRPRLLASGPVLTARGGHPTHTVYRDRPELAAAAIELPPDADAALVRAAVQRLVAGGAQVVKAHLDDGAVFRIPVPKLAPRLLREVVAAAHAAGLPAAVHCSAVADFETAMAAGADEVAHVSPEFSKPWVPRDLGARLAAAKVVWTPTLFITEAVTQKLAGRAFGATWRYLRPAFGRYLDTFRRAGGMLAAGTDSADTYPSFAGALPREVRLLADVLGAPPAHALHAATVGGASALRRADLGTLFAGAAGDVALYDGDPVRDLAALDRVAATVVAGRVAWER